MCAWLLGGTLIIALVVALVLLIDNLHLREQLRRQSLNEAWRLRQTAGLYQLLDRLTDRGDGWKDRSWD